MPLPQQRPRSPHLNALHKSRPNARESSPLISTLATLSTLATRNSTSRPGSSQLARSSNARRSTACSSTQGPETRITTRDERATSPLVSSLATRNSTSRPGSLQPGSPQLERPPLDTALRKAQRRGRFATDAQLGGVQDSRHRLARARRCDP